MTREELGEKIRWKNIIWLVGIVNPTFMIPQLIQLWSTRVTDGISLTTLFMLFFVQAGFSIHGFFLRDKPLLISNGIAGSLTLIVALLTIFFRF